MYIMDGPIYSKVELLDSNDNPIFLFPINSEAGPMVPTIEILNFIGNNQKVHTVCLTFMALKQKGAIISNFSY